MVVFNDNSSYKYNQDPLWSASLLDLECFADKPVGL